MENSKIQYTSPKTQNEIIDICGKVIIKQVIFKVKKAKFFAVIDNKCFGQDFTIKNCQEFELDLKNLVAQGYDGAVAMSDKFNGCAEKKSIQLNSNTKAGSMLFPINF